MDTYTKEAQRALMAGAAMALIAMESEPDVEQISDKGTMQIREK